MSGALRGRRGGGGKLSYSKMVGTRPKGAGGGGGVTIRGSGAGPMGGGPASVSSSLGGTRGGDRRRGGGGRGSHSHHRRRRGGGREPQLVYAEAAGSRPAHWTHRYKRTQERMEMQWSECVSVNAADLNDLKLVLSSDEWALFGERKTATEVLPECLFCAVRCRVGLLTAVRYVFTPKQMSAKRTLESQKRFRCELPRVVCADCAQTQAADEGVAEDHTAVGALHEFVERMRKSPKRGVGSAESGDSDASTEELSAVTSLAVAWQRHLDEVHKATAGASMTPGFEDVSVAMRTLTVDAPEIADGDLVVAPHSGGGGELPNGGKVIECRAARRLETGEEVDPFSDGFLICTQLVKTGGGDKAGLQVGDVFVKFGDYSKRRFPGLKAIATLVRRSPRKVIPVLVWRKKIDAEERAAFQKIALRLEPLRSHDADGGGVLGAVINTYPLPQPIC